MAVPKKLSNHLDSAGADYEPLAHRTVYTAYDLAQTLRHDLSEIVKTLLVKTEDGLRLVVLPASQRLDLKKLKKVLGVRSMSIANEKDMQKHFAVKPGAIHAFGTILKKTPVVADKTLLKAKQLIFPTGTFTDSVRMKLKAYASVENPVIAHFTEKSGLKLTAKTTQRRKPKKGKGPKKKRAAKPARRTAKKKKPTRRRSR